MPSKQDDLSALLGDLLQDAGLLAGRERACWIPLEVRPARWFRLVAARTALRPAVRPRLAQFESYMEEHYGNN